MRKGTGLVVLAVIAALAAWMSPLLQVIAEPAGLAAAPVTFLASDHAYVGPKDGCRKCHLKEYRSWESTPHATALSKLEGDDATNPECVRCHVTGFGTETGFKSLEETPALANVTCEACHGPGADYRDREVMKDRAASVAAGLHIPDEATCLGCHNADSPQFPGSFDFEEMKAKGVHEIKAKS